MKTGDLVEHCHLDVKAMKTGDLVKYSYLDVGASMNDSHDGVIWANELGIVLELSARSWDLEADGLYARVFFPDRTEDSIHWVEVRKLRTVLPGE